MIPRRRLCILETQSEYVEILHWNLCFEIKRQEGGGVGGEKLRLTCFHCGIIMMMKSLLQSSSKQ